MINKTRRQYNCPYCHTEIQINSHGLADHGAPAHRAEESVHQVTCTLRYALLVRAGTTLGDVVHELLREQRLDQAHRGDGCREWQNNGKGFKRSRHVGDVKARE